MPELPEVELARRTLDEAMHRVIRAVDDTDDWVRRPHRPGDITGVLVGGTLTAAHRTGKTMWCETADARGEPGPTLGVHLGMGGRIVVVDDAADRPAATPEWDRFTVTFDDGGQLRLFDKRRPGRVRLDPDLDTLGPDRQRGADQPRPNGSVLTATGHDIPSAIYGPLTTGGRTISDKS